MTTPFFRLRIAAPLVAAALALLPLASCERTPDLGAAPPSDGGAAPDDAALAEIGGTVSQALMDSLGTQLKAALEAGGPVAAVTLCQGVAMPLTEAAGQDHEGVSVRRTTLRPRNPANEPDDTDRAVLEAMVASQPPVAEIRREEGAARYYRPLIVQELCLKCHGDPAGFPEELRETLAQLYPDDAATGYSLGELRGAIRVDIPVP